MRREPMTVAITGASGFLGRYFCRKLAEAGRDVLALTRSGADIVHARTTMRLAEYTDQAAMTDAFRSGAVRAVVHLAGRAHLRRDRDPNPDAAFHAANAAATESVCRAAAEAGVRKVVVMSSTAVVGEDHQSIVMADTATRPATPYGRSKLDGEERARSALAATDVLLRIFRPPLVYGPGMRGNPLRLFRLVDSGAPLPFGGIRNERSMISAANLFDATTTVLGSELGTPTPFYVSDDRPVSTSDFIRAIGRALDRPVRFVSGGAALLVLSAPLLRGLGRFVPLPISADDIHRLTSSFVVDQSPFRQTFGWTPPVSLDVGLRETAAWWHSSRQGD